MCVSPPSLPNVRQFCDHIGCDANNRPLPPPDTTYDVRRMYGSSALGEGGLKIGSAKGVLIVMITIALAIAYSVIGGIQRARTTHEDLRPAKRTDSGGRSNESLGSASGVRNRFTHIRRRRRVLR